MTEKLHSSLAGPSQKWELEPSAVRTEMSDHHAAEMVAAANCEFASGDVSIWRTRTADGEPIDVPCMVLRPSSREDFDRSRAARGIDRYPVRERITGHTRFYVVSVD